jgi:hypothetical protein
LHIATFVTSGLTEVNALLPDTSGRHDECAEHPQQVAPPFA